MILDPMAKGLMSIGVIFILAGIAWQFGWIQALRLGHLPGDLVIERENVHIYFPLTTGLLISLVIALLNWLFKAV